MNRRRFLLISLTSALAAPLAAAARQATKTIPIVMSAALDPVRQGFVASLSRPGGNVTGLALLAENVEDKQVELLHDAVPTLSAIAVLHDGRSPLGRAVAVSAQALRLNIHGYPADASVRRRGGFCLHEEGTARRSD